jgi:pyridoxal/pyridoxine/pyridoxamine kinase
LQLWLFVLFSRPGSIDSITRHNLTNEFPTPSLPREFDGPGNIFTALLLANYIKFQGQYETIAERTFNSVFAVLDKTHELGAREIDLLAAVMAIIQPPTVLKVISKEQIEALQVEDHTLPLDTDES